MTLSERDIKDEVSSVDYKLYYKWETMTEEAMMEIVKQNPKYGNLKENVILLHPPI